MGQREDGRLLFVYVVACAILGRCFLLLVWRINESVETPSYLIRAPADPLNGLGLHHNGGVRGHRAAAPGEKIASGGGEKKKKKPPQTLASPSFSPLYSR